MLYIIVFCPFFYFFLFHNNKYYYIYKVIGTGKPFELLISERNLLASSFGIDGANGTTQVLSKFIKIPNWLNHQKLIKLKSKSKFIKERKRLKSLSILSLGGKAEEEGGEFLYDYKDKEGKNINHDLYSNIPCLYSDFTEKNVFLVAANSQEWKELQSNIKTGPILVELLNGKLKCPLPIAGQKGMSSSSSSSSSFINDLTHSTQPEVSFIIPMHDHVDLTLRCLLNILRFADEVPSAEVRGYIITINTYTL